MSSNKQRALKNFIQTQHSKVERKHRLFLENHSDRGADHKFVAKLTRKVILPGIAFDLAIVAVLFFNAGPDFVANGFYISLQRVKTELP